MSMRLSPTLAHRLRKACRANKYSQADFARAAGLTKSQASKYLSGKTVPTSANVQARIICALGLTLDWFSQ